MTIILSILLLVAAEIIFALIHVKNRRINDLSDTIEVLIKDRNQVMTLGGFLTKNYPEEMKGQKASEVAIRLLSIPAVEAVIKCQTPEVMVKVHDLLVYGKPENLDTVKTRQDEQSKEGRLFSFGFSDKPFVAAKSVPCDDPDCPTCHPKNLDNRENPCSDPDCTGEFVQVGLTQPNGQTDYECNQCYKTVSFP